MSYEIWDIESGNLVGSFETETEALALIGEFGRGDGGPNAVRHLMLGWTAEDGQGGEIAVGEQLLVLAGSQAVRTAS